MLIPHFPAQKHGFLQARRAFKGAVTGSAIRKLPSSNEGMTLALLFLP
jgi:hypothetical protein